MLNVARDKGGRDNFAEIRATTFSFLIGLLLDSNLKPVSVSFRMFKDRVLLLKVA
jgi:hypothetical protein